MSVSTVVKNACSGLGEGPHWEESTKSLLYVDINAGDVHRWNSVTGLDEVRHFGKHMNMSIHSIWLSRGLSGILVRCQSF